MTKPTFDFNQFGNLESAVARINTGAVQGFESHTSEYLAAAYAIDAANDYSDDKTTIEHHLDFLLENGAEFNKSEALKLAI